MEKIGQNRQKRFILAVFLEERIIKKGWKENGWPNPELKEIFGAQTESVNLTLRLEIAA
jgi:hypothetical protein